MAYKSELTFKHKITRLLWSVTWTLLARPLPRTICSEWKNMLLRLFGAKIHPSARVYSSAKIYYPANLVCEANTIIGDETDIYNVDMITLKNGAIVSQKAFLCTASHDINAPEHHLITAPIVLEKDCWVAADTFVGMGVTVGEGAVIGARSAVYKDIEPWTVVGGNPAKFIKKRKLRKE